MYHIGFQYGKASDLHLSYISPLWTWVKAGGHGAGAVTLREDRQQGFHSNLHPWLLTDIMLVED